MKNGKLLLKDGTIFEGKIFGAEKSTAGEVVFSTGMVGYPESLTDPSFHGQILTFTFPLIGNYGVPGEKFFPDSNKNNPELSEMFESSRIHARGIVVSEYSENYSHWHAEKSLSDWLKSENVTGITGIDTRALTQILREKGCMTGKIIVEDEPAPDYDPNKVNIVKEVSLDKPVIYERGSKRIIMIDCGVKNNTIHHFLERGLTIIRVPWDFDFLNPENGLEYTKEKEKKKNKKTGALQKNLRKKSESKESTTPTLTFDGVFISNGPGDPAMCKPTIAIIRECFKRKIPTFGICLGNQLMGLAAGAKTYKLKYGHRAQNQPCIEQQSGHCYMTSQNHGFAIDEKSLPKDWEVWFRHATDNTIEGIRHKRLPFFSVQFHPEANPGPVDTENLFDLFLSKIDGA